MDQPAPTSPGKPSADSPDHTSAGRRPSAVLLFVAVALILFLADLGLKHYAFQNVAGSRVVPDLSDTLSFGVPHHEPRVLIPGVLNLQLTANAGAIFGMGKGSRWVFVAVSVVACVFICRVFWRSPAKATALHLGLSLILAGAMGNLYDRLSFGLVRDMLHMFPGAELPFGLSWPGGVRGFYPWIFNLADVALLMGVALVVWVTWRSAPHPSAAETAPG